MKSNDQPLDVLSEQNHDVQYLENFLVNNVTKLTDDQKLAHETAIREVNHQGGMLFFIDTPGGIGKFLTIRFLATNRKSSYIALAVASSEM